MPGRREELPILALRDVVVFPGTAMPLIVGRPRSVEAVRAAHEGDGRLLLLTQRRGDLAHPSLDDLYDVGCVARVVKATELPDGNAKIHVEGLYRARLVDEVPHPDHFRGIVDVPAAPTVDDAAQGELDALVRSLKATIERYVKLDRSAPPDMLMGVNSITDPSELADRLIGVVKLTVAERQALLETFDVAERLERVYRALTNEIEFLQVQRKLDHRVRRHQENTEREAFIDDQVKAFQREGGGGEGRPDRDDLEELAHLLAEAEMTPEARARAERELRRLSQMNPMSAEATVVRNYLDWLLAVPWVAQSEVSKDLTAAAEVLDAAHHGLEDVKERILEYLAVSCLSDRQQGPILCLLGPSGVGKTSFARSIAEATGRPFARIALGGVRDEAEIRGHRRTYIGALPGRIVQALKRAEARNPVLLLDEVDKMSSDIRGDPASALLEVLDHEQNHAFNDHYLDLDFDLSAVMFVCTANVLSGIPYPLLDRLELIKLSGYTEDEKVEIAQRYLLPKQRERAGLTAEQVDLDDSALRTIVSRYTKESGVRALEREVGRVCRKVARQVVEGGLTEAVRLDGEGVVALLGAPRHDIRRREEADEVGVVQGLAVTSTGGDLLPIEVAVVPGKGKLLTTGKLGEALKESATAVFTYVRSRAEALGVETDVHETHDIHVHYPGVPNGVDGPSAGIAMATAVVSALTGIPVRSDTAMTGEISLRGRVLRIGGLKEKVLAAHRAGVARVLVPERNRDDLDDVPASVREAIDIVVVSHMDEVLRHALASSPLGPTTTGFVPDESEREDPSADDVSRGA